MVLTFIQNYNKNIGCGLIVQGENACFTRRRSLVQIQVSPLSECVDIVKKKPPALGGFFAFQTPEYQF